MKLSAKIILEKEFKSSPMGYSKKDVDEFLDVILEDYESFEQQLEALRAENKRLKEQGDDVTRRPATPASSGTTNFDILKRIANLEKHVFGSKLYE